MATNQAIHSFTLLSLISNILKISLYFNCTFIQYRSQLQARNHSRSPLYSLDHVTQGPIVQHQLQQSGYSIHGTSNTSHKQCHHKQSIPPTARKLATNFGTTSNRPCQQQATWPKKQNGEADRVQEGKLDIESKENDERSLPKQHNPHNTDTNQIWLLSTSHVASKRKRGTNQVWLLSTSHVTSKRKRGTNQVWLLSTSHVTSKRKRGRTTPQTSKREHVVAHTESCWNRTSHIASKQKRRRTTPQMGKRAHAVAHIVFYWCQTSHVTSKRKRERTTTKIGKRAHTADYTEFWWYRAYLPEAPLGCLMTRSTSCMFFDACHS